MSVAWLVDRSKLMVDLDSISVEDIAGGNRVDVLVKVSYDHIEGHVVKQTDFLSTDYLYGH